MDEYNAFKLFALTIAVSLFFVFYLPDICKQDFDYFTDVDSFVYDMPEYEYNDAVEIYKKISGVDVVGELVLKHIKVQYNIMKTQYHLDSLKSSLTNDSISLGIK